MRRIMLQTERLINKSEMSAYMKEVLPLPEYFGNNLDALADCLSESTEDIDFVLDRQALEMLYASAYAYNVVRVITDVSGENPHIRFHME